MLKRNMADHHQPAKQDPVRYAIYIEIIAGYYFVTKLWAPSNTQAEKRGENLRRRNNRLYPRGPIRAVLL